MTLSTSQPSAQVSVQTPMQVVTQATHGPAVSISQPTLANIAAVGTKPRPISQVACILNQLQLVYDVFD